MLLRTCAVAFSFESVSAVTVDFVAVVLALDEDLDAGAALDNASTGSVDS